MTNRIELILRTMTERAMVVKDLVDGENFSWAWGDLGMLLELSYRLSDEIKDRKSQAYSLMHDEIKEL